MEQVVLEEGQVTKESSLESEVEEEEVHSLRKIS